MSQPDSQPNGHRNGIELHRVYDAAPTAGARLLVDRLWPRGVAKADLALDDWIREAAPSDDLRHWFHADPTRWPEFVDRYTAELDRAPDAVARLLGWWAKGPVTLLFSARDPAQNNATVLRDYLIAHRKEHRHDAH